MRPRSNPDRNRKNDGIISLSEVFHVDDDDRIGRYAAQIAMRQELTERELGVMLSGLIHAHYTDQSKKAETNPLRDAIQRRIADENNATLSLGHALFPGTQHQYWKAEEVHDRIDESPLRKDAPIFLEANARRMLQRAAIIVFAAEALQEVEEFSVTEEEMLDLRRISMLYDPAIQAFRHDMIEANPHLAAALTGFEAQHPDLCERLYMLGGIRSAVASTLAERDAVHSEDEQNPILTFQPKSSSDTTPPSS